MNILNHQKDIYSKNFLENGDTPKGVFWNNRETQYLRFQFLLKSLLAFKPAKFSILDVGSGLCDLHEFLLQNRIDHTYTGVEIVGEMLKASREKFPSIKLIDKDIRDIDAKFDFVVLSGTFNKMGEVEVEPFKEYVFEYMKKCYELSEIGCAFNFLTSYSDFYESGLFYLNPCEAYDFVYKNCSRFVSVDSVTPLFEPTITVLRPASVESLFRDNAFKKYFGK